MSDSHAPFFDAHSHLQDPRLEPWLHRHGGSGLKARGIESVVVNGTHPDDWGRVASLGNRYDWAIASYGLHPWRVNDAPTNWKDALLDRLDSGGSAIGEIGLDRWIDGYDIDRQKDAFLFQFRLARERDLPVSIHCLRAWGLLLDLLGSEPIPKRGFLLHSYGGPVEMVESLAGLGARFSFSGYFARERAAKKREAFERVPLSRLLIETDAPDMLGSEETIEESLSDDEGKAINSPFNLLRIYEYAARMKGIGLEAFRRSMATNFKEVFL